MQVQIACAKGALPRKRPSFSVEDRATPPPHTIRVIVHGDNSWQGIGATAPHVVEHTQKKETYASKFLGP